MSVQEVPKKLKVLHVHDVAFVGSTLVSGLRSIGVDAELYTFINIKNSRIPKILYPLMTSVLRFYEVFRLRRYIRKHNFDIVHIHYGSFAYLALVNRIPFYLHIHGSDVRKFIHWPILGNIIRKGVQKAIAVIYSTPDLKELVEPHRKDAIFFPNPIDTDLFTPAANVMHLEAPIIFNINKIDRYKGIEAVCQGLTLMWEQRPDIRVLMFGYGSSIEEVKDFLEENVHRLIMTDRVPHNKMAVMIQESSIILGQMATGALGCSELEAMACGKPVVCKFAYPDMYPTPPPVCIANTPKEVSDHLLFLLEHPKIAQKVGIEARNWIVENYDKGKAALRLLSIYESNKK